MRGATTNSDGIITLGNSDLSHFLTLFPGRSGNPNPFISWKDGDPLRFARDAGPYLCTELMRIESNGNVGIGTTNPESKLEVDGQVKITGGSPGEEKVLTSDSDGLAHWEQNKFGFFVCPSNPMTIANGTLVTLTNFSESFNDGNGFNSSSGEYTIPTDGVYQFNMKIAWRIYSGTSNVSATIDQYLYKNTLPFEKISESVQISTSTSYKYVTLSGIVKANSGDIITFKISFTSTQNIYLDRANSTLTTVSGYKIY